MASKKKSKLELLKPIEAHATPRKCATCQEPAIYWKFLPNNRGTKRPPTGIDKSTRTPVCNLHTA